MSVPSAGWLRRPTWPRLGLAAALLWFFALGWWLTDNMPSWHEEVSVHASPGYRVLAAPRPGQGTARAGSVVLQPWCGSPDAPRWVSSSGRPVASLCIARHAFPVMVSSYFTGVLYWPLALGWPLHHGDVFRMRKAGLLLGVLSLWLSYRLAKRFAGERVALCATLALASLSPFAYTHTLLLWYEVLPWTFIAGALLAVARCKALWPGPKDAPREKVATGWLVLACGLLGLSVLANFKAVFVIAPLLALSFRARLQWRNLRVGQSALAVLAGAAAVSPMLVFARLDRDAGFTGQVMGRLGTVVAHLADPLRYLREAFNLLVFWSDTGFYGDLLNTAAPSIPWAGVLVAGLALGHSTVALIRVLRSGRGPWLAAGAGAVLWTYVIMVVLLYDQYPSANYAPLHSVFGLSLGAALADLVGVVVSGFARAPEAQPPSLREGTSGRRALAGALVAVALAPMAYNCVRRGNPADRFALSINAAAERSLAGYLRARPERAGVLLSTTYNLAGVLDSLGRGQLAPIQAHAFLLGCARDRSSQEQTACVAARWRSVLEAFPRAPVRAVVPARIAPIDEPGAAVLAPALSAAAASLGRRVAVEQSFQTGGGVPVITLYRVEPAGR